MRIQLVTAALVTAVAVGSGAASAGEPLNTIKSAVESIQVILKEDAKPWPARYTAIREKTATLFDWTDMAKRALGTHWPRLSAADQRTFTKAFIDTLEVEYVEKLRLYKGEPITFTERTESDGRIVVRTQVQARREVTIEYVLYKPNGSWLVYDVLLNGVSVVGNHRSQYQREISKTSYADLLAVMKKKRENFDAKLKSKGPPS